MGVWAPAPLSQCTPVTSSREPAWPARSPPRGLAGAHTHPGGMNRPEGAGRGSGRLPSEGRARRAPLAAAAAAEAPTAAALTAVAAALAAAARAAGASASCRSSHCRRCQAPARMWFAPRLRPPGGSRAARRPPRPAPLRPRPAGPTPRPRVTPRSRPPAGDKSGLAGARRAPYLRAGGFPAAGGGAGLARSEEARRRTAGRTDTLTH